MENKFTAEELIEKGFRLVDEDYSVYLEYVFDKDNYELSSYLYTNDVIKSDINGQNFIVGINGTGTLMRDTEITEKKIDYLIKEHTI